MHKARTYATPCIHHELTPRGSKQSAEVTSSDLFCQKGGGKKNLKNRNAQWTLTASMIPYELQAGVHVACTCARVQQVP